jgi:hypothetical protein
MNLLTTRQQEMLSRGLAAFDQTTRRRRKQRLVVRCAAAACVAVAAVFAVGRALRVPAPTLPAYVELIRGDAELVGELQLASACERIERTDGQLRVLECVAFAPRR